MESPISVTVKHFGYRGTTTGEELVEAVDTHLAPYASPQYRRALQQAKEHIIQANDQLAEAALAFGEVKDTGGKIRADTLRAHIELQHHALATYLEAVAIVADDDTLKERAKQVRATQAGYVEAMEACVDGTVAAATYEPAATVH